LIEDGSLWINTNNNKSYLKENGNWQEKDFIKEQMKDQEQLKALNQLLALVIGGRIAKRTEHLKSAPLNRITHAQKIIADEELQEATRDLQDGYDDASRKISQVERKLDSLSSLKVLAGMVEENVRDAALAAITEGANSDGYMFDEYNEFEDKYK
tara:strand:- start:536 stop:1000 length:465 start_codon:yes stop_codon:yes gene_type:complete